MKFVTISSTIAITVTFSLSNADKTNYNSRMNNSFNIAPLWTRNAVRIKKGKHLYPAEIANWATVKALEQKGVFTIGQETDEASSEDLRMLEEFEKSKTAIAIEAEAAKKHRKKSEEQA